MALENAAEALGGELGDYYIDEWEIPQGELSEAERRIPRDVRERIDARREETILYVRRQAERHRRRRRRIAMASVGVVALLTLGIAQLLASSPKDASDVNRAAPSTATMPASWRVPGQINTPAPAGNSVSVSASHAGAEFVITSFIGYYGLICAPLSYVRDGVSERRTSSFCAVPKRLDRDLQKLHAVIVGSVGHAEAYVLKGYASHEVESLGGPGWKNGFVAELSAPWVPWAAGIDNPPPPMRPLRTFVALARPGLADASYESLGLTARLSDGRVVPVGSAPPGRLTWNRGTSK